MRARPRILVSRSPRLVIVGLRQMIQKVLPVEVWDFVLQLVSLDQQSDLRHFREDLADASAIGPDGKLFVRHHIGQLQSVGVVKGPLQQRGGDLEADEIVIGLRRIAALRDL